MPPHPMKVLFISNDFAGASLCRRLADEGNQVQAVVAQASCRAILDGVVGKAASLAEGLAWAGRESLIVVDEHGFGALQDELRAAGHAVVGGCAGADRMEEDRPYCQDLLKDHGLHTLPTHHFPTVIAAIDFLTEQRGRWVLKQNGYPDKSLCYAGRLESAEDLLDLLRGFAARGHADSHIILQQRADGVEIGVARYFNGRDWLGPVEMNIEHKKLFPGDLGPNTCEMGTLMWFDEADGNRLFNEVLAPLAPHLRAIGFHGDIDVNCIVNDHGAWPLEVTPRFGYPATQCQMELFTSNWTDFLLALAQGHDFDPPWRRGYALAALAALPPFPYRADNFPAWMSPQGLKVRFRNTPSPEELRHYHFEEARLLAGGDWELCCDSGYALHVTAFAASVEVARNKLDERLANLAMPRLFYRDDLGESFVRENEARLRQWGYLP